MDKDNAYTDAQESALEMARNHVLGKNFVRVILENLEYLKYYQKQDADALFKNDEYLCMFARRTSKENLSTVHNVELITGKFNIELLQELIEKLDRLSAELKEKVKEIQTKEATL